MFWVDDNHIGVSDRRHHHATGNLALFAANLRLHLRTSLGVFHLVLHFLLGHFHLFVKGIQLIGNIDGGGDNQG